MKLNNIKYKYGIFKIRFTKSFDVTFLLSYYTESYQTNRRGRFQDLFTFPEKKPPRSSLEHVKLQLLVVQVVHICMCLLLSTGGQAPLPPTEYKIGPSLA